MLGGRRLSAAGRGEGKRPRTHPPLQRRATRLRAGRPPPATSLSERCRPVRPSLSNRKAPARGPGPRQASGSLIRESVASLGSALRSERVDSSIAGRVCPRRRRNQRLAGRPPTGGPSDALPAFRFRPEWEGQIQALSGLVEHLLGDVAFRDKEADYREILETEDAKSSSCGTAGRSRWIRREAASTGAGSRQRKPPSAIPNDEASGAGRLVRRRAADLPGSGRRGPRAARPHRMHRLRDQAHHRCSST